MHELRRLEHALHFLTRRHLSLVTAALNPDRPGVVHVGFGDPVRYRHDDDDAVCHWHVFSHWIDRRAYLSGSCVADELIYPLNISGIERLNAAVIRHTNEELPPAGICEGDYLTCKRNSIRHISLELMAGILSTSSYFKKFYCFQIS